MLPVSSSPPTGPSAVPPNDITSSPPQSTPTARSFLLPRLSPRASHTPPLSLPLTRRAHLTQHAHCPCGAFWRAPGPSRSKSTLPLDAPAAPTPVRARAARSWSRGIFLAALIEKREGAEKGKRLISSCCWPRRHGH